MNFWRMLIPAPAMARGVGDAEASITRSSTDVFCSKTCIGALAVYSSKLAAAKKRCLEVPRSPTNAQSGSARLVIAEVNERNECSLSSRRMRRDPRIINLYDRPLYSRHAPRPHVASSSLATTLLSCTAITLATVGFFWGYDAVAHRDPLVIPSVAHIAAADSHSNRSLETPAPNMRAPEIVRANADASPSVLPTIAVTKTKPSPDDGKTALPQKKKAHIARRISPEAKRAYPSEPGSLVPHHLVGGSQRKLIFGYVPLSF